VPARSFVTSGTLLIAGFHGCIAADSTHPRTGVFSTCDFETRGQNAEDRSRPHDVARRACRGCGGGASALAPERARARAGLPGLGAHHRFLYLRRNHGIFIVLELPAGRQRLPVLLASAVSPRPVSIPGPIPSLTRLASLPGVFAIPRRLLRLPATSTTPFRSAFPGIRN